jgi:hypothetical protein
MNRLLEDKKPANNSVDTNLFWKGLPINLSQDLSFKKNNITAFCEFVDDVVNIKLKDYETSPDNYSGYPDISSWNDMFNIGSMGSSEDVNINYFNLFVENNE